MGETRACGAALRRLDQAVVAGQAGERNGENRLAAALGQMQHPFGLLQPTREAAHIIEYAGKLRSHRIKGVVNPPSGIDGAVGQRGNAVVADGADSPCHWSAHLPMTR